MTLLRKLLLTTALSICSISFAFNLSDLQLPAGYQISIFAEQVENARQLAVSQSGWVYAGSRKGWVTAVIDDNQDGDAERVIKIAEGLYMPSGIALKGGDLYVAAVDKIYRAKQIDQQVDRLVKDGTKVDWQVVYDNLPDKRHHGWKFIAFGPNGDLFAPVGAPCNVCDDPDERFNTILKIKADFTGHSVHADGIRNSVGFDWQPSTGKLWFTDNGRDHMGDDIPACELNRIDQPGQHFGFPYLHASSVPDPEFGKDRDLSIYTKPQHEFGAHTAPLGMHFYRGQLFGPLKDQALIALHGSWNRSSRVGYKVVKATFEGDRVVAMDDFVTGWLIDEKASGRPVDIAEWSDGSLLISDDGGNRIYRITKK